jgi:hypothetical protein
MAEFWAAELKNGPVKLLAALEISGLESGPIPNFLIAAYFNKNWPHNLNTQLFTTLLQMVWRGGWLAA